MLTAVVLRLNQVCVLDDSHERYRAVRHIQPIHIRQRTVEYQHDENRRHVAHIRQSRQIVLRHRRNKRRENIGWRSRQNRIEFQEPTVLAFQSHVQATRSVVHNLHAFHCRTRMHLAAHFTHTLRQHIEDFAEASNRIPQLLLYHALAARLHPRLNLAPHPRHAHIAVVLFAELAAHHRTPEYVVPAPAHMPAQPLVRRDVLILAKILLTLQVQRRQPQPYAVRQAHRSELQQVNRRNKVVYSPVNQRPHR